jgi:osmoprotectant transport system permease protein
MRSLNRRLEVDAVPVAAIAKAALDSLGVSGVARRKRSRGRRAGPLSAWRSFVRATVEERGALAQRTMRHLLLSAASLLAAALVAIPFGVMLERRRLLAEPLVRTTGLLQTIPGIALLAFMIPLLGIGIVPALVALFVYSLYPIVRNTYSGVRDADPVAVNAAHALGMTPGQVLRYVRLPLAAPTIMAGVRTAAVINIGTATLAAFIGAGGPVSRSSPASRCRTPVDPERSRACGVGAARGSRVGVCEKAVRPRGI